VVVMGLVGLLLIIPTIAVTVRRLHDVGQSGWLVLVLIVLSIIPFLGVFAAIGYIVLGCVNSQPGANRFGPPPKAVAA
jgi:uncharacterized membrane protein YhaH (DUF805 family)